MTVFKRLVWGFSVLILVASVFPFIRTDEWWVRVFDFPRLQIAIGNVVAIAGVAVIKWLAPGPAGVARWLLLGCLAGALVANVWWIVPYTELVRPQVLDAVAGRSDATLRVLTANVLQDNRNSEALRRLIETNDPDVILLTETDDRWTRDLSDLTNSHPYFLTFPLTNTYGMNMYSRLPLEDPEVRFLTDPGIPSVRATIVLGAGRFVFYGVHPRPPGRPSENQSIPQDSTQRDAELVLIAKEVRAIEGPVVVAGDFNDVAWSHTTRLFQRISRLIDPRVGRGFFNTYPAKIPALRFPLDHLFHSDHFTLVEMKRLPGVGSDHFPIFVALNFEPRAADEQEAPSPKASDSREATEQLQEHREEN